MKDLSACRILIVDDVKANIDVLVQALGTEHKLSIALSGEAALRSVAQNPPDLVLLDIVMPGMDGYEVCRRLRAAPQTRELPVMFLSSLDEVQNKTQGFEVGGNDYLTKPFEVLEAKARVRSLLKAKAYSDAVREKLAAELQIARDIQLGILPSNVAERVQGTDLDICAKLEPAREVGGDLYEVLRLDDGRLFVALGDVSGKGIPAALFMAVTTTMLRTMARQYSEPDQILRHVNDALAIQNPRGMFVTLVCLIVDPAAGRVSCANAGHQPALLLGRGEAPQWVLHATGMVAGTLANLEFDREIIELRPGETLVLYTDGVTEAFDPAGALFGEARLEACVRNARDQRAAQTLASVMDAIHTHVSGAPQSDDITVLTLRRKASAHST